MDYRVTDGEQGRVHKEYVDIIMRNRSDGTIEPLVICWKDGRTFPVDEVLDDGSFGSQVKGSSQRMYKVRFGSHETEIYYERRMACPELGSGERFRWWMFAFDSVSTEKRGRN